MKTFVATALASFSLVGAARAKILTGRKMRLDIDDECARAAIEALSAKRK